MLVEFSSLLLIVEVALSSHIAVFFFLLLIDFSQALFFSDRLDCLLPDILAYIHAFLLLVLVALLVLHSLHLEHVVLLRPISLLTLQKLLLTADTLLIEVGSKCHLELPLLVHLILLCEALELILML